jgi:hypothetical protein
MAKTKQQKWNDFKLELAKSKDPHIKSVSILIEKLPYEEVTDIIYESISTIAVVHRSEPASKMTRYGLALAKLVLKLLNR